MKKFIFPLIITLAFSVLGQASGKFIFMPETNYTKQESKISMGISVYEHIIGPVSWTNYTGMGIHQDKNEASHHMHDFVFQNGLITHLGSKLDLEFGHKYLFNRHERYHENKGYVKVSAQLW